MYTPFLVVGVVRSGAGSYVEVLRESSGRAHCSLY